MIHNIITWLIVFKPNKYLLYFINIREIQKNMYNIKKKYIHIHINIYNIYKTYIICKMKKIFLQSFNYDIIKFLIQVPLNR